MAFSLSDIFKGGTEGIFAGVADVVKTFKADPTEVMKLQHELEIAQMQMETALSQAQTQINAAEAANTSIFVSGWRPFIGWVCGLGFAYEFLIQPFLSWVAAMNAVTGPPALDMSVLSTLLMGMLGLGGMRSFERYHGVHEK